MVTNEHGSCTHCGYDFNGDYIYDTFLEKYGTHEKASEIAEMYGAREGYGRWGKCIYVKPYDNNYKKLEPYWICPECGGKQ